MFCPNLNNKLVQAAAQYARLGYQIGVTNNKELIDEKLSLYRDPRSYNGISMILDGIACVDFDRFTCLDARYALPPTLKERSPRGLHYFYRLPARFRGVSKIGWKTGVDLLTRTAQHKLRYSSTRDFEGHVLCSPSKGYTRLYPRNLVAKNELTAAPAWLVDHLL